MRMTLLCLQGGARDRTRTRTPLLQRRQVHAPCAVLHALRHPAHWMNADGNVPGFESGLRIHIERLADNMADKNADVPECQHSCGA